MNNIVPLRDFNRRRRVFGLLLVAFCVITSSSFAQTCSITKIEQIGDYINLYYNIQDTTQSRTYSVSLYSSADGFVTPLSNVSGDIGLEVPAGNNHKVAWNAKATLGADFVGPVSLELRGKPYVPFVRLTGFDDFKKFKRTNEYNITWAGGRGNDVLVFDLYNGETKVASYPNVANVGHYALTFDKTIPPGKNYKFRISDSKNKDDVVWSSEFTIQRKVPLIYKAAAAAAVIAGGYLIIEALSKDEKIKDPPKP